MGFLKSLTGDASQPRRDLLALKYHPVAPSAFETQGCCDVKMFPFLPASLEVWRGLCRLVGGSCMLIPTCHQFTVIQ